MAPRGVTVAVTVVGLLQDTAFHVAKCAAEVIPGLRPQCRVGSSGEQCGLEVNKQSNALPGSSFQEENIPNFQASSLLWH